MNDAGMSWRLRTRMRAGKGQKDAIPTVKDFLKPKGYTSGAPKRKGHTRRWGEEKNKEETPSIGNWDCSNVSTKGSGGVQKENNQWLPDKSRKKKTEEREESRRKRGVRKTAPSVLSTSTRWSKQSCGLRLESFGS